MFRGGNSSSYCTCQDSEVGRAGRTWGAPKKAAWQEQSEAGELTRGEVRMGGTGEGRAGSGAQRPPQGFGFDSESSAEPREVWGQKNDTLQYDVEGCFWL